MSAAHGCGVVLAAASVAAQTPPASSQPPRQQTAVNVVAITPVAGLPVLALRVPPNVQTVGSQDLKDLAPLQTSVVLAAAFASVHGSDAQASTFQPDIQFRGFTASPLLGVSQGLALYEDGVRQ